MSLLANAYAYHPYASCTGACGVQLRLTDHRRRRSHREPHADPDCNPNPDRYAYPHTNANAYPHTNANAYTNADPHRNTDPDPYAYRYADTHSCPVPVDRVPAWCVAGRRADRSRRVRGHRRVGNVRMGAAQQAQRRRRGRALRGLDDRSRDRCRPADRRRVPCVRGLWLVVAEATADTYTYAYTYPNGDALSHASARLPRVGAVHDAE